MRVRLVWSYLAYQLDEIPEDVRHSSGYGIDRTQYAHSIGRIDCSKVMNTCIPISSICCVQFITTSDPFYSGKIHDGIFHRKGIISWDSKDMIYSDGLETSQNVFNDRLRHRSFLVSNHLTFSFQSNYFIFLFDL